MLLGTIVIVSIIPVLLLYPIVILYFSSEDIFSKIAFAKSVFCVSFFMFNFILSFIFSLDDVLSDCNGVMSTLSRLLLAIWIKSFTLSAGISVPL